ncbi:hypothetical protein PVAND_013215 [Polypedilum vanderplanki]|uniref:C2H2-type domain-containing protein n=1 Tax=Polypedilum vanderplanki TaxID=319348 RepID=A0A9J6CPS2_POLVA|nr:hypothetical protein PVAND_013215 [Polypedilum vanderplanki]
MKKKFIENQNMLHDLLKRKDKSELYVKVEVIGEQYHNEESKSENQKKKIESLYRVEEVADETQTKKIEHLAIESTEIKETQFFCDTCKKDFKSKNNLKVHVSRTHLKKKFKKSSTPHKFDAKNQQQCEFLCSECGINFKRLSCLKRHFNIIHLKIKRYQCDNCSYRCYKKESIRKHMSTHLPQDERNFFKCHRCPEKTFSSIYSLKLHEKNFHKLNQKKFHCTYQNCERSFSREISLKEHIKFVHLKCRPINCDQCELSFASNNHLRRHKVRKHKQLSSFK